MDENRNPFDFEQPNSNSDEPKSKGSHTAPSTECPQQGAHDQSENAYFLNRISKKEVLIFRRINGTLLIRESFLRIEIRLGSKFHITPMSSNIPMEQDIRILGIKTTMTVHFLIGMDSIGKMERDSNLLLPDGLRMNQKRR